MIMKCMAYMMLKCLIVDIRWVPLGNYNGRRTLAHDTQGNHVGRINTDYSYIIGKINDHTGHFYAVYRQEGYMDTTTHQYEVDHQSVPPPIQYTPYMCTDVFVSVLMMYLVIWFWVV